MQLARTAFLFLRPVFRVTTRSCATKSAFEESAVVKSSMSETPKKTTFDADQRPMAGSVKDLVDEETDRMLRTRTQSGYASRLARAVQKKAKPSDMILTPVNPIGTLSIGKVSESIKGLVMGNERFRKIHFAEHEQALLDSIRHGQRPKALFMGCSDSRVLPDAMMQVKAGDLFVSRNIGAFVPPYTYSSAHAGTTSVIQYAVTALNVQEIIVCTHSHCGACAALYHMDNLKDPETPQLGEWLKLGERARDLAVTALGADAPRELLLRTTERLVAVCQLEHLMTHPYIKRRMEAGSLFLHAWHYSIETGEIWYYDSNEHDFKVMQQPTPLAPPPGIFEHHHNPLDTSDDEAVAAAATAAAAASSKAMGGATPISTSGSTSGAE